MNIGKERDMKSCKSIFILALLLFTTLLISAFCSIASADFYVTDSVGNIEIEMRQSEDVNLYIWYSGDDNIISFDYIIAATGPGRLPGLLSIEIYPPLPSPSILATGRNPEYDVVRGVYDYTNPENPVLIPNAYEMGGASDGDSLGKGLAYPLAYVVFFCDGPSPPDVVITLTDICTFNTSWGQIFPVMHGMTIHQIPEPATIALLCLGGLLLRKK
jgi:hypothetical protein